MILRCVFLMVCTSVVLVVIAPGELDAGGSNLRSDPKLQAQVTIVEDSPDLKKVLKILEKATRITLSVHSKIKSHQPKLGGFQFRNAHSWMVMKVLAKVDLKEGQWIKKADGYQLTAKASLAKKLKSQRRTDKGKKAVFVSGSNLQGDSRLWVKPEFTEKSPSLTHIFARLQKTTNLAFSVDDNLAAHDPVFVSNPFPNAYAWMVMEVVARTQLQNGRWMKTGDGYRLTAKASLAAKVRNERKLAQKFTQKRAAQPDRFPLRNDHRLYFKLTIHEKNPKLSTVLFRLASATGLTITLDDSLISHDPELGHMQMRNAPAFSFMELLANRQLKDGRWEKTEGGYCLHGTSTAPGAVASRNVWPFGQALAAIVISIAGIAFLALCAYAITRKSASKTPPSPSKTR